MSQALPCGKHVFASRLTCVCQNNVPIEHAVYFYLRVLLRYRWVAGERTWFLLLRSHVVTLFLACDRFPAVPCHLTDHFCFALLRFSMVVVRSSMCRCCGVRHANAQPSLPFATCPQLQFGFLVCEVRLPGTFIPLWSRGLCDCLCQYTSSGLCEVRPSSLANRCAGPDGFFLLDAHKPWCSTLLSASARVSRSIFSCQHAETTDSVDVVWNAG